MTARLKEAMRPLRAAAQLGFQIESNWSDPLVFAVYALAKPLATSLILYVMFQVIVGAGTSEHGGALCRAMPPRLRVRPRRTMLEARLRRAR